jgi:DNA-binding MarR family transcriptional regulator
MHCMEKKADSSAVWALFLTTHAVLLEVMERRLAEAGLPPLAWYDALWALERAAERRLRLSDMAEAMVISRSNLTRLVDRLEEAGLVKRERSEDDRRGAYAVITARGAQMRRRMWPVYSQAIAELFEGHLSAAEAQAMQKALGRALAAARGSRE